MKFFSPKWLHNAETETDFQVVFDAYSRHLLKIKGVLPDHVMELASMRGIDDGLVVSVLHDRENAQLELTIRCGDLVRGYFDLIITYCDVQINQLDAYTLAVIARMTHVDKYGHDLAYHELDLLMENQIEHRFHFHTSMVFKIQCGSLTWIKIDQPDRKLPEMADRFPNGPTTSFVKRLERAWHDKYHNPLRTRKYKTQVNARRHGYTPRLQLFKKIEPIFSGGKNEYTWGNGCFGYHLVQNARLSVIREEMPPGTSEVLHMHNNSQQFFYVLKGELVFEINGQKIVVLSNCGIQIPPGIPHLVRNEGEVDADFLVISQPPSHGDRVDISTS